MPKKGRSRSRVTESEARARGKTASKAQGRQPPQREPGNPQRSKTVRVEAASGYRRGGTRSLARGRAETELQFEALIAGVNVLPNVRLGAVGTLLVEILGYYPKKNEISVTSGMDGDHGQVSHHYGLTYRGSPTAAIDIGGGGVTPEGSRRMRDVARWLYENFAADTVELIHTTPYPDDNGFYVKNGQKYPGGGPYAGATARAHADHVHFASSRALAEKILTRLRSPAQPPAPAPTPVPPPGPSRVAFPNISPVWGWDASSYDWGRGPVDLAAAKRDGISFFTHKCSEGSTYKDPYFKQALERARAAGIPVMGAYHVLWPGNPIEEARIFFNEVNSKAPWWREVPWIWQLDAEKFESMPRAPSPEEGKAFLDELKRLAGGRGYFIAYAPKWVYGDRFNVGYDLWASNYTGSGGPRNFKEQYQGVTDNQAGWQPYSGRKPRILQFSSDAVIGTQKTCDANKLDGDLYALVQLTGQSPFSPLREPGATIAVGGQGVIYAIQPNGDLMWFRHLDPTNGSPSWAQAHGVKIGSGWSAFTKILAGDGGVLYAVQPNGDLMWFRHLDPTNGSPSWAQAHGVKIGSSWSAFTKILAGDGGVLYAIQPNGDLMWFRHLDPTNGSPSWAQAHGVKIGSGWSAFTKILAGDGGVLYAVQPNGDLMWFRHLDPTNGSPSWAQAHGVKIGSGWGAFTAIFAGDDGVLYAIQPNGDLLWFRHLDPANGSPSWAQAHGVKIGSGWGSFIT
jgi:GH25 family lysozyme M1 (1,4-beta-N-acetylmuramidase)